MMACPPDPDLDRLLAGELTRDEESALETHVAGCAACQTRLDLLTGGLMFSGLPAVPGRGREDTSRPPAVLARVADFPASQVQILEHEHALERVRQACRRTPAGGDGLSPAARPRFTVLGPHAEGGLGRVHLANDEQLRRVVAVKEIRPDRADDPILRRRFLNEAQITGQLEHPGIVPIYALEYDDAGRPAYAMRFIRGRTLGNAIEGHHRQPTALGLRELLQRYISVCQTVAYAHSKGVIHRDLKPDNVMLGDYGETLVVDWGLAKRLGDRDDSFVTDPGPGKRPTAGAGLPPDPLAETVLAPTPATGAGRAGRLTVAGQVMGTPAYMAPEQARGERLSPAADVYALGAVLYHLLTGKAPRQGTSAIEILRKAAAGGPPTAAGLPRALTAICAKAMAADSKSRYASAANLAGDVERWLADEPVSVSPDPWLARAARWARRHRTLVTSLGVAAVVLVVTGVAVGWWQSRVAEERRFEAARNGEAVETLLDRCEAAVAADDAAAARLAVDDAEKRAAHPGADHLRDRLARCRAAADLLVELDRIDDLRWDPENGKVRGVVRAVREWPGAFARLGVIPGRTPPADAAGVLNGSPARERLLAALDLWLVAAPPDDRAALAGLLAAADPDPFRDAVRAAVVRSDRDAVMRLAARDAALRQPARFAAALGSIAEVPHDRKVAVLGTAARGRPRDFAIAMTAGSLYRINEPGTAADRLAWYRSAVAVRPGSVVARGNLAVALRDRGDLDGAIAELRAAIALDPDYAMVHNNLGVALRARNNLADAIAEYRTAIRLDPGSALAHNNLGSALTSRGELAEAVAEFRTAIDLDPKLPAAHSNLGYALQSGGDLPGAIAEFLTAIALDPKYAPAHSNLGNARRETGDLDGALAAYREAERFLPKGVGTYRAETEKWKKLLPRVDDVAAGRADPATSADAAEFSRLFRLSFQKRFAASARLYAKACDADPKYATDATTSARRYDAARSAALAGCGKGADAPADPSARAALRGQALAWLETNRKLLAGRLASVTANDQKPVADQLSACLTEHDLAGVRPGAARDGWSPSEAAAWNAYWADVRAMLAKAIEPSEPVSHGK